MMTATDTRIFCKLSGGSERFKVVCFHKHKYTCFQELVQEIAAMWDDVPATGTLLLVAAGSEEDEAETNAVVEDVHHLRDGDKCIFVPTIIMNTTTTTRTTSTRLTPPPPPPPVAIKMEDLSQEEQLSADDSVQVHYPEEDEDEEVVDDDDEDSDSKDHDNDDDDDEPRTTLKNNPTSARNNTPPVGTKYFYKRGGTLYPVVVSTALDRMKRPEKGEYCVRHDGVRGMAWSGYRRACHVKISDLEPHTKERELKYHRRMRLLKTKSAKSGRTATVRNDKNDKNTTSNSKTAAAAAAAAAVVKEKDCISAVSKKHPTVRDDKKKKNTTSNGKNAAAATAAVKEKNCTSAVSKEKHPPKHEKQQHRIFQIKSRFFCWDDGVEYPAFVKKLAGQTHGQQIIKKGHVYVKWINFPGGKVVQDEDLLPFTARRIKEYRAWEEQITMESDSEEDDDGDNDADADDDDDEPEQDHAESDDDQDVSAKCPDVGSRFFAVKDGLEYLALVKKNPGAKYDKKIIPKGHCYIKWIGYHGGKICKVSDLLPDTARRRSAYQKREMQMAMESSSDEEEEELNTQNRTGADKKNHKQQNSSRAAQLTAKTSDDEEGVHEESEEEKISQQPEVGERFFILQNDVPYPAEVTKHKKQPVVEGTCTVKWIGFRGGTVVHYSDLLAYTERRRREYRELTKCASVARKAIIEKKNERARLGKKRKAEEGRESKKRQKREAKRCHAKDLDLLYGPATDISSLRELCQENQAEGRIMAEPEKNRFVYFARDSDTPEDVAREFQVDVGKIIFDNIKFTKKLTKSSPLVSFTPIVIPIKWGGSTVTNPCQVVKQEDDVMRSKVVEDVAASPGYNKPICPSQQGSVSVTPTQN